jgi:hypothetical protein
MSGWNNERLSVHPSPSNLGAARGGSFCIRWVALVAGSVIALACSQSSDLADSGQTAGANGGGGAAGRSSSGAGGTGAGGVQGTGGTAPLSTDCTGTPLPCGRLLFAALCAAEHGCTFDSSTKVCGGTASDCGTYSTSTSCLRNGCKWTGALACNPTPVTSDCTSYVNTSDPCEVCLHSQCCGQLTACSEDKACSNASFTGPVWNAYIDCQMNCCPDSCVR